MPTLGSLRRFGILAPLAILIAASIAFAGATGRGTSNRNNDHVERSDTSVAFRNDMRKLWEDHITWTRLAIISIVDDAPDQEQAVDRLLQNQADIGNAIMPYYGDAAGTQLTALLHDHITIAAEILVAARAGDTAAFDDANARWYATADEIAAFLNSANPDNWPLDHMQQMMREHLDLTLAEGVARLTHDYDADVVAYDRVHNAILPMADMLSLGIIDQFPKQFK
jgi:hypothetical protein